MKIDDSKYIDTKGRGTIKISSLVDGVWYDNYMTGVLYVPDICHNLFSLSACIDKGMTYFAEKDKCVFKADQEIVAVGIRKEKLFKLLLRVRSTSSTMVAKEDTLQLRHERLGHQNKKHVHKFLEARSIKVIVDREFCDGCMYGKQHRQRFGHRIDKASVADELIHSDVCGPMQEKSLDGANYFCDFKDDFLHYRRVYFLRENSKVKDKLRDYLSFAKSQQATV